MKVVYYLIIKGKVQKKTRKKITSVSFAFSHTYTPVKTNIFPFFPQAYMENFEKLQKQKNKKHYIVPCYLWLAKGAPCGQDITPLVQNLYSER